MPHAGSDPAVRAAITVVKSGILLAGGLVTYFCWRAYRRTRGRPFAALTAGFGIITLGALLAGLFHVVVDVSLAVGVLIDGTLTLAGLLVVAYSLYAE